MNSLLKKPSAWLPIVLSLAMLVFMLVYIAIFGAPAPQPDADEGVGAHIFQLWLVLEVLLVAFFALTWLPRAPKEASFILAIQIIAALAACAPIFYFRL